MSIGDPRYWPQTLSMVGAFIVLAAMAVPLEAQRRVSADSIRHIQSVEPRSGPPGTVVSIATENLPLEAKVHVGVGATHAGFESLAEAPQGEWGEIALSVRIPPTATWDRAVVFIAFNAVFSPIGMSDPFHVTNDEGHVQRTGRITDEDPECLTLRDTDGYLYTLAGSTGALTAGEEVVVEGTYSETGACELGNTIHVTRVARGP